MAPHQERVVTEKKSLDEKLFQLKGFLETDVFEDLDSAEQERLRCQVVAMTAYSDILQERIAAFKEE